MRLFSLLILSILILTACNNNDGQLPTQAILPGATKTLIPTQSQLLVSPTLPENVRDVNIPAGDISSNNAENNNSVPDATNTPFDCNLQTDWEVYTVQRGDNLANIASRTGSTVSELTLANCIENPDLVRVGQDLYVPNLPDQQPSSPINVTIVNTPGITVATRQPTSVLATQTGVTISISKTFESEIGFGLTFPADWYVTQSTTSTIENAFVTSFEYTLGDEIPQNSWTDNMVSLTITTFLDPSDQTLSEWSQDIVSQFQNATNINEVFTPVTLRTDGNLEGQSIDYITEDDTIVRNYYFIINDRKVQINIGGNFDLAVPVINSLKPVSQ